MAGPCPFDLPLLPELPVRPQAGGTHRGGVEVRADLSQRMVVFGDCAVEERVWATWCVCRWLCEPVPTVVVPPDTGGLPEGWWWEHRGDGSWMAEADDALVKLEGGEIVGLGAAKDPPPEVADAVLRRNGREPLDGGTFPLPTVWVWTERQAGVHRWAAECSPSFGNRAVAWVDDRGVSMVWRSGERIEVPTEVAHAVRLRNGLSRYRAFDDAARVAREILARPKPGAPPTAFDREVELHGAMAQHLREQKRSECPTFIELVDGSRRGYVVGSAGYVDAAYLVEMLTEHGYIEAAQHGACAWEPVAGQCRGTMRRRLLPDRCVPGASL